MGHEPHRVDRGGHGALRRHHRRRPERHQEGAGLLDGVAAGLHVPGRRRRRVRGRDLPPGDPRLLQGPAVPGIGIGHPRDGRRAGHAALRRPSSPHAHHRGHVHHRLARHRRRASICRLLVQGRDLAVGMGRGWLQRHSAVGRRHPHRATHCVLHEPASLHDLLRPLSLRRPRSRRDHDGVERLCGGGHR